MSPGRKRVEENLIAELQNYMQLLQEGTSQKHQAQSRLEMSSQSDEKFEGIFVDEEGSGVYFLCEDHGSGGYSSRQQKGRHCYLLCS